MYDHRAAHDWAIVLAGACGGSAPTAADRMLVHSAIARASRIVAADRVVAVTGAPEHGLARTLFDGIVALSNLVVQPCDRGSAAAVLLPLLAILERDPVAHVALLPARHMVRREQVLVTAAQQALDHTYRVPGPIELLGLCPDERDDERVAPRSWIVPGARAGETSGVRRIVAAARDSAGDLRASGAFWNGSMLVAPAISLVGLFQMRAPRLLAPFLRHAPHADRRAAAAVYAQIRTTDLLRDLLIGAEPYLRVRAVTACGWSEAVADAPAAAPAPAPATRRRSAFVREWTRLVRDPRAQVRQRV